MNEKGKSVQPERPKTASAEKKSFDELLDSVPAVAAPHRRPLTDAQRAKIHKHRVYRGKLKMAKDGGRLLELAIRRNAQDLNMEPGQYRSRYAEKLGL